MFHKIKKVIFVSTLLASLLGFTAPAFADPQPLQQLENQTSTSTTTNPCNDPKLTAKQQASCADCNTGQKDNAAIEKCLHSNVIVQRLQGIVNFLAGAVGVVIVAGLIVGGIQYSMAGDSPEAVGKAKTRIRNVFIALLVYIFFFAMIQWLFPGGSF